MPCSGLETCLHIQDRKITSLQTMWLHNPARQKFSKTPKLKFLFSGTKYVLITCPAELEAFVGIKMGEDGGSRFLQIVCNSLPNYTAAHAKKVCTLFNLIKFG